MNSHYFLDAVVPLRETLDNLAQLKYKPTQPAAKLHPIVYNIYYKRTADYSSKYRVISHHMLLLLLNGGYLTKFCLVSKFFATSRRVSVSLSFFFVSSRTSLTLFVSIFFRWFRLFFLEALTCFIPQCLWNHFTMQRHSQQAACSGRGQYRITGISWKTSSGLNGRIC